MRNPPVLPFVFAAIAALLLSACETTTRVLPQYEARLLRSDFQTVRTTAYTHTESDHREFSNHNALGGELHAAEPAIHRAENVAQGTPVPENAGGTQLQPFSMEPGTTRRITTTSTTTRSTYALPRSGGYGSAAADWSRWPAGTIFRLLSTGQVYRVDDYGWALSGRNTIDLYMATRGEMNSWGARKESIQVLQWGDPQASLRLLAPHQNSRHIKRMVLEIEGREREAATMQ